jgi:hypothetical protein
LSFGWKADVSPCSQDLGNILIPVLRSQVNEIIATHMTLLSGQIAFIFNFNSTPQKKKKLDP